MSISALDGDDPFVSLAALPRNQVLLRLLQPSPAAPAASAPQQLQGRRAEDLTSAELADLLRQRLQEEEEEEEAAAAASAAADAAREEDGEDERDGTGRDLLAGQRIYNAAKGGDVAALRPLLQQWRGREDVLNWSTADESTPLHIGSRLGRLEAVQLLLATPGEAPFALSSLSLSVAPIFCSPPSTLHSPPHPTSPRHRRQQGGYQRRHGHHGGR